MTDIVKECMRLKVLEIRDKFARTGQAMDLISEISNIQVKVLLECAFGEDVSHLKLDYYQNDVKTQKSVAFILRDTFHKCLAKLHSIETALFPF